MTVGVTRPAAARLSREIAERHVGAEAAANIEKDVLQNNIARVFTVAGAVGDDGNMVWEGATPSDPRVVLLDAAVKLDFGDITLTITPDAAERLACNIVSALETGHAKTLLSSGPVADLLGEFMRKFGGGNLS